MRNSQQQKLTRVIVYSVLSMMALFYLAPLYVMVSTSFKTTEPIRAGGGCYCRLRTSPLMPGLPRGVALVLVRNVMA